MCTRDTCRLSLPMLCGETLVYAGTIPCSCITAGHGWVARLPSTALERDLHESELHDSSWSSLLCELTLLHCDTSQIHKSKDCHAMSPTGTEYMSDVRWWSKVSYYGTVDPKPTVVQDTRAWVWAFELNYLGSEMIWITDLPPSSGEKGENSVGK